MKSKINYFLIPAIVFFISWIGRTFVQSNMAWYRSLILPVLTPPDWTFGVVWSIIYILSALVAIYWNNASDDINIRSYGNALFLINGFLNVLWTFLFFGHHMIGLALIDAAMLQFSTIALFYMVRVKSVKWSLLIVPYVIWNFFAMYLNAVIWHLNP